MRLPVCMSAIWMRWERRPGATCWLTTAGRARCNRSWPGINWQSALDDCPCWPMGWPAPRRPRTSQRLDPAGPLLQVILRPLHVLESRADAELVDETHERALQRLGSTKALFEAFDDLGGAADHRVVSLGIHDEEHVERRCEQARGIRHEAIPDPVREIDIELARVSKERLRRAEIRDVELAAADAVEKPHESHRLVEAVVAVGRLDAFRKRASIERRLGPPDFMARLFRRRRKTLARQHLEALLHF